METQRLHEVVHTLRGKPLHVRENITLAVSGGLTLIVALGWFGAMAVSGGFSLSSGTFASQDPELTQSVASGKSNFSDLIGAAGAAISGSSSPSTIQIVDSKSSSTLDQNSVPADATVIHF